MTNLEDFDFEAESEKITRKEYDFKLKLLQCALKQIVKNECCNTENGYCHELYENRDDWCAFCVAQNALKILELWDASKKQFDSLLNALADADFEEGELK